MNDALLPIDVVYTWVDGSDPDWAERNRAFLMANGFHNPEKSQRFASHDELRYSLRSLERFMPWANRIFIVTDRQVPTWLHTDHPKIRIVDHTEIFEDKECLPTFNSVAIESNLHRIPGLAERYVYFNDDMILGSPFGPEDFFAPDGRPRSILFQVARSRQRAERIQKMPDCYRFLQMLEIRFWIWRLGRRKSVFDVKQRYNRLVMIRRLRRNFPHFKVKHTPIPLTQTMVRHVEGLFREDFERSRRHRFRTRDDLFFPELYATVGILEGLTEAQYFELGNLFYHKLGIKGAPDFSLLEEGRYKFISINDDSGADSGRELDAYRMAMNRLFPNPSVFEK